MTDRRRPKTRREELDRRIVDRRDDPREEFEAGIRFLLAGKSAQEVVSGELLDVSQSGIRILFAKPLRPSDKLLIEVRDAEGRCYNLMAEVIWVEAEANGRQQAGCELCAELNAKQYALLKQLRTSPSAVA